ncbi:MAG: glucuronate isomerase [Prevotellaceae bacterium]|jgi:glucuronate isomerase|nr:glucuronate isomerase [Prevotellaceae bacterium]
MKQFIDNDFILQTKTAQYLYHTHSEHLPIIDYHCHLDPELIAKDYRFDSLGELWLANDHYKWRAMRANGIDEKYITGKTATFWEKFEKWAETVPYTMRNPLYHWTHLELKRVFGIDKILNPETAKEIYDECSEKLRSPEFSARGLMKRFKTEAVCTTDDPVDSLENHTSLKKEGFEIKVLPTWRPDRAMAVESPEKFRIYIDKLAEISGIAIENFSDLIAALRKRHDFFASVGCKLSDHGFEKFYAEDYTENEINAIFSKVYNGKNLLQSEVEKYKSAVLFEGAVMDCEKGWTQQFHYGVIRNNNTRMFNEAGADAGFDSMSDPTVAKSMAKFFDRLNSINKLTKTVIYNLNPRDNYLVATMAGNFQDGSTAGKMQFGPGWWFLDQKSGIEMQINNLSELGLLSRFIGMLTDSRSFVSYTRHEYFRRILCNIVGNDIEQGLLPASELSFTGQLIENISYYNAKNFLEL